MQITSCYFPDLDSVVTTCFLDKSSKPNLGNKALLDLITVYSLTSTLCSSCPKVFAIPGFILHFLAHRTSLMLLFCATVLFSVTPILSFRFCLDVTSSEKAFCDKPPPHQPQQLLLCLQCLERTTHYCLRAFVHAASSASVLSLIPVAVHSDNAQW